MTKGLAIGLLVALTVTGCASGPSGSAIPSVSASSPAATASALGSSLAPSPQATPGSPSPTQGTDLLRIRPLPQHQETTVSGIRIRRSPGLDGELIATLLLGETAMAVLGPLLVDGYSWYRVEDDSGDAPNYIDGWMAVGTSTDPWVKESVGWSGYPVYPAAFDGIGPGQFGPVALQDVGYGVVWAAAGDGCQFTATFVTSSGDREEIVSAVASPFVSSATDPQFFADHPDLVGGLTLVVDSGCSWAVVIIRYVG
jgi:hypothetical protein